MENITEEYLRSQRDRPVVLKTELAKMRSANRCALVFVIEGKEDLPIYEIWLRRAYPELRWEPLVARGKRNLLEFRKMMHRDATGLRICTYFVIDHDYDGMRGYDDADDIYVLPAYSVENYFIDDEIIDAILRSDFRIVGDIELRRKIVGKYRIALEALMKEVLPACVTLFAAKNCACGNINIDENYIRNVRVDLDTVVVEAADAFGRIVTTEQEVGAADRARAKLFFDASPHTSWIRGKFLFAFAKKWVARVHEDVRHGGKGELGYTLDSGPFNPAAMDVRAFAARSSIPAGLTEFVRRCEKDCIGKCQDDARRADVAA